MGSARRNGEDVFLKYGRKFFGSAWVDSWLRGLENQLRTGVSNTTLEDKLRKGSGTVDEKAAALRSSILEDCFRAIAYTNTAKARKKPVPFDELKKYSYQKPKLVMRLRGHATVNSMGKTTPVDVEGKYGIECTVLRGAQKYVRPTVIWVSKPFHQYRAVDLTREGLSV